MKNKYLVITLSVLFGLALVFTSCNDDDESNEPEPNTIGAYNTPKYIFYFIGDGMSTPQINIAEAALNDANFTLKSSASVGLGDLNIRKFPVTGMQTTQAEDRYITGSAASATALATGYKTTINTIGMNGDRTQSLKTMAEMAKEKGMKVGIVSSVSIDHATPACFYAHTPDRNNYYSIGQDLAQSGFDYFAGGGVRWNKYNSDAENPGMTKDINLFLNALTANSYSYVNNRSVFEALTPANGKVVATLERFLTDVGSNSAALPYTIDLDEETNTNNTITLSEFTKKGIEILDNEKGFFMMVEGGKIDWACHANDVVSATHNTVEFDKAIGYAIDFYNTHKDETLIVVTGDHECGGLTLGFASTIYETAFTFLNYQSISFEKYTSDVVSTWDIHTSFEDALTSAKQYFGLGDPSISEASIQEDKEIALDLTLTKYDSTLLEDAFNRTMGGEVIEDQLDYLSYGGYDPFTVTVTHILNNKAGIDWTSYSHTGSPVPVFALGQGMYEFSGYYDNTDVAKKIIEVAELAE